MKFVIELFFFQSWILLIAVTFANALVMRRNAKKHLLAQPELKDGYDQMFRAVLIYGNIPWLIMAIGNLSGITRGTFDYLAPSQMNPMVLIFHFSIVVLWILSVRWIYFKGGADFLERHPGMFRQNATAKEIKIFFPLMLAGGIFGMIMMWFLDIGQLTLPN